MTHWEQTLAQLMINIIKDAEARVSFQLEYPNTNPNDPNQRDHSRIPNLIIVWDCGTLDTWYYEGRDWFNN